jgi:hypothetical protein
MLLKNVPLLDVLARWGYSEVINSNAQHHYDNGRDMTSLRSKRQSGIAFEDLSLEERYNLAFQSGCVRSNLIVFTIGVDLFDVVELDRPTLAKLIVPPNVWYPESSGEFVRFEHFMATTAKSSKDARNVALDGKYSFPSDPLTIGRFYEHAILLDGYHRAGLFWRFGPHNGNLAAHVPHVLLGAFGKQVIARRGSSLG